MNTSWVVAEVRERTGSECNAMSSTECELRNISHRLTIRPHLHLHLILRRRPVVRGEMSTRRKRRRDRGHVGEVETGQDRIDQRPLRNRNRACRAISIPRTHLTSPQASRPILCVDAVHQRF
jgi:hypothetical protein